MCRVYYRHLTEDFVVLKYNKKNKKKTAKYTTTRTRTTTAMTVSDEEARRSEAAITT